MFGSKNPHDSHAYPMDWGRTSADYDAYRRYPRRMFDELFVRGIGVPGQRIVDVATGTGLFARGLAKRGAHVVGVDIAPNQIEKARSHASRGNPEYRVAPAEATGLPSGAFDVVTAAQCFGYFDAKTALHEFRRLTTERGLVVVAHLSWLPRVCAVAKETERILLRHNPGWGSADFDGEVPDQPAWSSELGLLHRVVFDVAMQFAPQTWAGRMRACRALGATVRREIVHAASAEIENMTATEFGDAFTVIHRADAHVLRL